MEVRKDLCVEISCYLRNSKRKKIRFKDYCRINHIDKMTEQATLKVAIMSSSLLSFTYSRINNTIEMIIMLQ